jgi:Tol biopolymer transport system component
MKPAISLSRPLVLLALASLAPLVTGGEGDTERASVSSSGAEANNASDHNAVSADGRYVAFASAASNLVAGDTNFAPDIFVRDRQTGQTTRVSVGTGGVQGNSSSYTPDVSDDGRYVVFESTASNLVPNDFNLDDDVFVHDRQLGTTVRVSVGSTGAELNGDSHSPCISGDGRYVAFVTGASFVVPGIPSGQHVYRHDLATGTVELVSASTAGVPGDGAGGSPSLSADGRTVAFDSTATNLVAGDTNGQADVFVRDMASGETFRVSVTTSGEQAFSYSVTPSISADGRRVAFAGRAALVPFDLNGLDDVYLHDRDGGTTQLVTVDTAGGSGDSFSYAPSIAADGKRVAFHSRAPDLVSDDGNFLYDVFVRHTALEQTVRVSVDSTGVAGDDDSRYASISADGAFVAYMSEAANLVPGDGNAKADVFVHEVDLAAAPITAPPTSLASSESHVAIAPVQARGTARTTSASYVARVTVGITPSGADVASAQHRAHVGTAATPALLATNEPLVFGASPAFGAAAGGEPVAVHGFNLGVFGPSVTLASVAASGASAASNTVVTATTGPGTNAHGNPLGTGDVAVTTLFGTASAPDAFVYGPALSEGAPPRVGQPYALDVHLRAGELFQVAIGKSLPGVAVPVWPLTGATELLLGVTFVTDLTAAPAAVVTLTLPIPASPSLAGTTLELQGAVLTSVAPLAGSFTNRLATTVGP